MIIPPQILLIIDTDPQDYMHKEVVVILVICVDDYIGMLVGQPNLGYTNRPLNS